jgi:hypothetical protein
MSIAELKDNIKTKIELLDLAQLEAINILVEKINTDIDAENAKMDAVFAKAKNQFGETLQKLAQ